jgi:hypothetical protein
MLLYPSFAIIFDMMLLCPLAAWITGTNIVVGIVSGIFGGFALQILYSAYRTTKWRIWAFSRVTDVHELKIAAIDAKLIAKDGSWQNKLEIRTKADKKALQAIQARYDEPYKFVDDVTVPTETEIYYTSSEIAYKILFWSCVAIIVSIIIFAAAGVDPYGLVILAFGGAGLVGSKMLWPEKGKRPPAVILSNEGIHAPDGFSKWQDISEEEVHRSESHGRSGTNVHYQLRYKVGSIPAPFVDLNEIDIPSTRVIHILYIYRRRNEAAQNS